MNPGDLHDVLELFKDYLPRGRNMNGARFNAAEMRMFEEVKEILDSWIADYREAND